jgi:ribose-phosphate pyrophosphokinase
MKVFAIPTSSAEHLTQNISRKIKRLGKDEIKILSPDLNREKKRYFPDGEIYMKILEANKLKNKRVIVLHSGVPKPNEGLVELELILQILRDSEVKPEVFFAYFPYGMQDKVFEKGETNVAENLVEKLVNYYKVRKIYVIDPHFGGRKWVEKYPIKVISAVPILIERAREDFKNDILFLTPDIGAKRRTKIKGFKKKRLNSFSVEIFSEEINFKGKVVGVIDDMIKTGGTLLKFQEITKKAKAKKAIALITHGVIPSGVKKVKRIYDKLYLTNTIFQKEANTDITDLILKSISSPNNFLYSVVK